MIPLILYLFSILPFYLYSFSPSFILSPIFLLFSNTIFYSDKRVKPLLYLQKWQLYRPTKKALKIWTLGTFQKLIFPFQFKTRNQAYLNLGFFV